MSDAVQDGMDLFWLGPLLFPVGSRVAPGNWGRIVKKLGGTHTAAYRELLWELVRQEVAPNSPSRLDACFLFLSANDAVAQRITRPLDFAYSVALFDSDASTAVADMGWIDQFNQVQIGPGMTRWDVERELAMHYWSGDMTAAPVRELLTLSDIEIVEGPLPPI